MAQSKQKTGKAPATPLVEARIDHLLSGEGKTKAFASATIAGAYAIHGLRVIESEKGVFVSMPQESYTKNGGKEIHRHLPRHYRRSPNRAHRRGAVSV